MTCKDSYQEMTAFQQNFGAFLSEISAHANLDQMPVLPALQGVNHAESATDPPV
jgi:hypothetical protein